MLMIVCQLEDRLQDGRLQLPSPRLQLQSPVVEVKELQKGRRPSQPVCDIYLFLRDFGSLF